MRCWCGFLLHRSGKSQLKQRYRCHGGSEGTRGCIWSDWVRLAGPFRGWYVKLRQLNSTASTRSSEEFCLILRYLIFLIGGPFSRFGQTYIWGEGFVKKAHRLECIDVMVVDVLVDYIVSDGTFWIIFIIVAQECGGHETYWSGTERVNLRLIFSKTSLVPSCPQ